MPSQANSSLRGFNKAVSTAPDNSTTSVFKGGGANSNTGNASGLFHTTSIPRPTLFDGNSNDGLVGPLALGSGHSLNIRPVGTGTIRDSRERRKRAEVTASNLMFPVQDGLNNIQSGREVGVGASGIRQTRDGRWISATGAYIVSSGFGQYSQNYVLTAGSGATSYGDNANTPGRLRGTSYTFRNGAAQYKINLGTRTG